MSRQGHEVNVSNTDKCTMLHGSHRNFRLSELVLISRNVTQ